MVKIISLTTPIGSEDGAEIESINFTTKEDSGKTSSYSLPSDSPNFQRGMELLRKFQDGFISNEDLADGLMKAADVIGNVVVKFKKIDGVLNGRMAIHGNNITVDYEPIDPALETYILRLLREDGTPRDDANWRSFSRFVEKLYSNTSEHVRAQLFGWLQYENTHGQGFTIAEDGDIIGYKGCAGTIEEPLSIHSGLAIVDGVRMTGRVPNKTGSVIEMPRTAVQDDPAVGCSTGLHIGTYQYASGFSQGVLLKVKWSPADTVSVPTECQAQKVRVCRYTVLEVTEGPDNGAVYYTSASDFEDEEIVDALEEAIQDGENITFVYNGVDRSVTGVRVEASGWKLEAIEDGVRKSFVLARMTDLGVDGVPFGEDLSYAEEDDYDYDIDEFEEAELEELEDEARTQTATAESLADRIKRVYAKEPRVRFNYHGVEREGVINPHYGFNSYHLDVKDDSGRTKTYLLSKISDFMVLEDEGSGNETNSTAAVLQRALDTNAQLLFRYSGTSRRVTPVKIFEAGGRTLLGARDVVYGEYRNYVISQMEDLRIA